MQIPPGGANSRRLLHYRTERYAQPKQFQARRAILRGMLPRFVRPLGLLSLVFLAGCAGDGTNSTIVDRFAAPVVLTEQKNDPLLAIVSLGDRRVALVGERIFTDDAVTATTMSTYGVGPTVDGSRPETTVSLDAQSRPTRVVGADGAWIDFKYAPGSDEATAEIHGSGGSAVESVTYFAAGPGGVALPDEAAPGTVKVTCGNTAIDMPLTVSFRPSNQVAAPPVVLPVGLVRTGTGAYRTDLPSTNDTAKDPTAATVRRAQLKSMLDEFEQKLVDNAGLSRDSVAPIVAKVQNANLKTVADRLLRDVLRVLDARDVLASGAEATTRSLKNESGRAIYRALALKGEMKSEEADAAYNNTDLVRSFDFNTDQCEGRPFVDAWEGTMSIDDTSIACNLAVDADKSAVLTWPNDGSISGTLTDAGHFEGTGQETVGGQVRKWRLEADFTVNNATLTGTGRFTRTDGAESPHSDSTFTFTRVFQTSRPQGRR